MPGNGLVGDHERFKNILSGVQSLTVSVAIVVGGLWTLHTFGALAQVDRARAELDGLKRALREQGVLELSIDATPLASAGGKFLHVTVTAQNKGNRNMMLNLSSTPPVKASRAAPGGQGPEGSFEPVVVGYFYGPGGDGKLDQHLLRVGEVYRYHSLLKIEAPGIYLVSFDTEVTESEEAVVLNDRGRWTTSTYVVVQ